MIESTPYLIHVWKDVEPKLLGPFASHQERDEEAKNCFIKHGPEHGYFRLNIGSDGPEISSFAGSELGE